MKKHIVTIAGRPGSGKSTTAKMVAAELGFQHFSSGDFFRAIGKEMGIDVLRTNRTAEENSEIDRRTDGRLQEIGQTEDRLVIDSRMAWHWMPESYKVFLELDLPTAAGRIIGGMREQALANEAIPSDPAQYVEELKRRLESEARRYRSKYGVDAFDPDNYDLVVDTAKNDAHQVVQLVVKGFEDWLRA